MAKAKTKIIHRCSDGILSMSAYKMNAANKTEIGVIGTGEKIVKAAVGLVDYLVMLMGVATIPL